MCGDVGPWRPSGGCEHDECELVELEVEAWRTEPEDQITGIPAMCDFGTGVGAVVDGEPVVARVCPVVG